ncbi:Scarecrow-like protein [Thalictrum thalictroides]|uniref:Scarecrow-like protein n=1 Tax=Thalictrum thalictroides TaxID=46969 RepID=A0A7J6VPG4_THATH|nr:Scarecrow-like protein [Thalictrum thalictroides]
MMFEKDDSTLLFKNNLFEPQSSPSPILPDHTFFNEFNLSSNNPQSFTQSNEIYNNESSCLEFDCSQLDQLIRAASCYESNELPSAQLILARLNQQLRNSIGKPLQRSAFYFKEALQFLLSGSNFAEIHLSSLEIVNKIKAYKSFSEISPITMFANFTANQALLEALDGAMFIHIVDFEIGIGGQWASFMQEIASKAKSRNVLPSSIRITAVIPEECSMEASLIRDNLQQFAQELGIQFQLEFILFNTFEELLFNSIRFINGELIAVNLSPRIFRRFRTSESISGFLRYLRRVSPRITVFMDSEGCRDTRGITFRRNFVNGLEFYSSLFESLDAASGGDMDLVRRIEKYLLRPKIFASVSGAGNSVFGWRELFSSVGMIPVQFSEFTDSQAEWLVRRAQIRGFHVTKRQGSMLLCWHDRELVATSAWRC